MKGNELFGEAVWQMKKPTAIMKKNVGLHYSPYDVECDGAEPQTGKRNKEIEKVKSVKAFRFNL